MEDYKYARRGVLGVDQVTNSAGQDWDILTLTLEWLIEVAVANPDMHMGSSCTDCIMGYTPALLK